MPGQMIASKGDPKVSGRRTKSLGWAAFDQQQKLKDVLKPQLNNEPFPSLSGCSTSVQKPETSSIKKHLPTKPFSSVVLPSVDFPAPALSNRNSKPFEIGSSGGLPSREVSAGISAVSAIRQLRKLYSWADDSLIEDIMVAAGSDIDVASSMLKSMVSDDIFYQHTDAKVVESSSNAVQLVSNSKILHGDGNIPVQAVPKSAKACSVVEACVDNDCKNRKHRFDVHPEKLFYDYMETNTMPNQITFVPLEPEWEEDDVYLSCRKDAIRRTRAAARHSKAATNSFQMGDHDSAKRYSLKAEEEWEAANRLNAKAAHEILSIRNENNGIWRLDLHGLHAVEAVQALQEHLHMIETQHFKGSSRPVNGNLSRTEPEVLLAPSLRGNNVDNSDEQAFHRQLPKWLEVITGIGNHSRGGASLPTAVKTFLVDNGYRIDEARPGVVMVKPKLRFG